MVRIFCILVFILLTCGGTPAQAQQQMERAQYFDPSGQVRAEELASQAFAPSPAQVRLGLQTGNLWLKLSRTVPADESLYLYQAHPSAGLVNVYAPSTAPAGPGARWPGETLSAKELQGGKLLLPRAATPQQASYYVQIQSQGLHWIQVDLLTGSERAARQQREWMVLSAQLAFVALAFTGTLFQLLHTGRRIYLGLIGFNTQFLLYHLNMNGLLIDAWGQSAQGLAALSVALTVAGLTGFALLVPLVYRHPSPAQLWTRSKRLSVGAALALFLLAFVLPRGPVVLAALLLASVLLLETAYHLGRLWYVRMGKGGNPPFDNFTLVSYLLMSAACMLLFLGMYTPRVLFLTPPDLRQVDWPVICTLLFLALVRRQHKETALQTSALVTAAERLRLEVARRGDQQHFMAMLVHEIRGPLTVIQLGKRALTQRVLNAEQTAVWAQRHRHHRPDCGELRRGPAPRGRRSARHCGRSGDCTGAGGHAGPPGPNRAGRGAAHPRPFYARDNAFCQLPGGCALSGHHFAQSAGQRPEIRARRQRRAVAVHPGAARGPRLHRVCGAQRPRRQRRTRSGAGVFPLLPRAISHAGVWHGPGPVAVAKPGAANAQRNSTDAFRAQNCF